jgi:hypothetical protein
MHQCEFCPNLFSPRPQVKRPRACSNCQFLRQQENEKTWHSKNKEKHDALYHRVQKGLRVETLSEISKKVCEWLRIGMEFKGGSVDVKELGKLLLRFFLDLGIRRVNKFCAT